jgi:hypothetical protein
LAVIAPEKFSDEIKMTQTKIMQPQKLIFAKGSLQYRLQNDELMDLT